MIKRCLLSLAMLVVALSSSAAQDSGPAYVAGVNYDVINARVPRSASRDKIELAEFFWYGCGHCYNFEPLLEQWKKTIPDDAEFRGIPAVWREVMELHARAFYTAEALGVLERLHPVLFQAMNVEGKSLSSAEDIAALFVANGVARADFDKTFNSFGVTSQVGQAVAIAKGAGLTGTPSLMVNGKYLITAQKAGGQAEMLKVADFLIAQERASLVAN